MRPCRLVVFRPEQGGLEAILIRYLQLMEGSGDNRVQELSKKLRSLKVLAVDLMSNYCVYLNWVRGVEVHQQTPIWFTYEAEYWARRPMIYLYRDIYYNPDSQIEILPVIIAKHRNESTGTVEATVRSKLDKVYCPSNHKLLII